MRKMVELVSEWIRSGFYMFTEQKSDFVGSQDGWL